MLLLDARHKKRIDISDFNNLKSIAGESGADIDRFIVDFNEPGILDKLSEDYLYAVNNLKIFGTPTFVFKHGSPVFLKLASSDFDDNLEFFREFMTFSINRTKVLEIKRP